MTGDGDLVSLDGDLTEDDSGDPLFVGIGAVVGVGEGQEGVTVDRGMAGGFVNGEVLDEPRASVKDGSMEVVAIKVMVELVLAVLAAEPAGGVAGAEAGIGRPAIGPSFEDIERDGR